MKALTLWQPWAWAMAENLKPVENRPWPAPPSLVGYRFALHAGLKWDQDSAATLSHLLGPFDPLQPPRSELTYGAVVAVCRLVCVVMTKEDAEHFAGLGQGRWFFGPYGWIVDEMKRLEDPVPCRGYQKLWNLPPDVEAEVRRQVGEVA